MPGTPPPIPSVMQSIWQSLAGDTMQRRTVGPMATSTLRGQCTSIWPPRTGDSLTLGMASGLTKIVSQCLHGNGRIFNPARVPARDFEFAPGKYHYMRHGPTLNKTARAVFVTFGGCAKSNIIVPADIAKQGQPATRTVRQIGINPYRTEWERTTAFCALVSRTTNITMPVFYRMLTIRTFSEPVDAKKGASTWEDDMPAGTCRLFIMSFTDTLRSLSGEPLPSAAVHVGYRPLPPHG